MKLERYGIIGEGGLKHIREVLPADRTGRTQYRHIATCDNERDAAAIAEMSRENNRPTAAPHLPWRPASEHGATFSDGEQMMVAVPVRENRTGAVCWEIWCVFSRVDDLDDTFILESLYGDDWGWDWCDVEWWLPMREVLGPLPCVEAAEAAERQGE